MRVRGTPHGKTPVKLELAAFKSYDVVLSVGGKVWKKKIYLKPPQTELHADIK